MKKASRSRLPAEIVLEAKKLSNPEARLVVSNYYAAQDQRKRLGMQIRHFGDKDVIVDIPQFLNMSEAVFSTFEKDTAAILKTYAESTRVGRWAMSHMGIGPVITAGLLAHIDIALAPTVGHIWAFAGLDPTRKWEKGQKRPYNADLKQLTYHLGECVKRVSNHPDSYYGKLYREKKAQLVKANDSGKNAERAKTFVTRSADVRKVLATGKLPDGNIDRQACNWVAKIFLSHLHAVMYWDHFKGIPPRPFAIQHLGHAHEIAVPNSEAEFPGFYAAYYKGTAVAKPPVYKIGDEAAPKPTKRRRKSTGDSATAVA